MIDSYAVIYDLKVTERIRPDDWWRTAKQLKYFIQDGWYSLVAQRKYEVRSKFRFWAIENVYPYRVKPYFYDDRSREIVQEYILKKLDEFSERQKTGNWDDAWSTDGEVGPWDVGANDEGDIDDELDWSGMEGGAV